MNDFTQHIVVLLVDLYIPSAQSLKERRMVLKSLKDKIRTKFNVSIAQLDTQDKWQTATLGIAMIGNDNRYLDSCMQNILSLIEHSNHVEISDHRMTFL